jgi:hypothetical protein
MRQLAKLALIGVVISGCCKEEQVPTAMQGLYSSVAKVRNESALILAECGSPLADKAVPRLITLMYDENPGVQSSAAYALRRIDTPEAATALEKATNARKKH